MFRSLKKDGLRRIQIESFGPIQSVEMELSQPLQILIGPQASGKSTIVKTIYFCRKMREYLTDYTMRIVNRDVDGEYYTNFLKYLRAPFMGCFGTTKHMQSFKIHFDFNPYKNKYVDITRGRDGFVSFGFSESIKKEIMALLDVAVQASSAVYSTITEAYQNQSNFVTLVRKETCRIFEDDAALLYIPAGRSMLASIPDLIQPDTHHSSSHYDISQTDAITQNFIRYIQQMRDKFGVRLDDMIQNYLKTVKGQIPNNDVRLACDLIKGVLKADYVYDNNSEKLYYDKNNYVKLMFGSSGQQEILWALNCLFLSILQREKTFFVIEEPEAHLFPDAQELIARLVILTMNSNKSEVFLTTHSPYMLTSFNLLIYSGRIEPSKKSSIVPRRYRIDADSVAAYLIPESHKKLVNLIDSERGLIDALQIDQLSDRINEKMDRLLLLEMEQEKEGNETDGV